MGKVKLPGNISPAVTLGVVDENARTTFTNGQCHSFALALHKRTGFPLVGVQKGWWPGYGHFMVHDTDRDLYLDIEGAKTEDEVISEWQNIAPTTETEILEWTSDGHYYDLHIEEADTFVAPLLASVRSHHEGN